MDRLGRGGDGTNEAFLSRPLQRKAHSLFLILDHAHLGAVKLASSLLPSLSVSVSGHFSCHRLTCGAPAAPSLALPSFPSYIDGCCFSRDFYHALHEPNRPRPTDEEREEAWLWLPLFFLGATRPQTTKIRDWPLIELHRYQRGQGFKTRVLLAR